MRFTEPAFVAHLLRTCHLPEPVLEVGAGWTPDYHRQPFFDCGYSRTSFLTQDATTYPPNPPADIIGDVCALDLADQSIGTALCFNVLEHCHAPWRAVPELTRVLSHGGWLIGSVPCRTAIHRWPRDYWRFMPDGIAELLRGLRLERLVVEGNPELPANLLFAARKDPAKADWLAENEAVTASPYLITDTDYLTESALKKAAVRLVRRFGYDLGLWTRHDGSSARMLELGYQRWQIVPQGNRWPDEKNGGGNGSAAT